MEIVSEQQFEISVSSFTHAPRRLSNNMTIAWAGPPPEYYAPLEYCFTSGKKGEVITAVLQDRRHLNKKRSACLQSQIVKPEKKAAHDAKDWYETVQISSEFEHIQNEVLSVLELNHEIQDGHLG